MDRIKAIQSRHFALKPISWRTSNRYSHETGVESLAMSSLKTIEGVLLLCITRARLRTYKKLSCMHRFLVNALWEVDTRWSRCLDNLIAKIFDRSLAIEWIRLLGL